jgi:hypothetical protein
MQEGILLAFESKQFKGNALVKYKCEKETTTILHAIKNGDNISLGGILKSIQSMIV